MTRLKLVRPGEKYRQSWVKALAEFKKDGDKRGKDLGLAKNHWWDYLKRSRERAQGKNLSKGKVPETEYWLVAGQRALGIVKIRRRLNKKLRRRGGHIGYAIRPSARKKGYGTKILELALAKARRMGLTKVMLSINKTNTASRRVIEKNGGLLEDEFIDQGERQLITIQRFWIKL